MARLAATPVRGGTASEVCSDPTIVAAVSVCNAYGGARRRLVAARDELEKFLSDWRIKETEEELRSVGGAQASEEMRRRL